MAAARTMHQIVRVCSIIGKQTYLKTFKHPACLRCRQTPSLHMLLNLLCQLCTVSCVRADTYADVGEASKVNGIELLGTRVPESILDDSELPEGPQQRDKLRPDILIVGDTATAGPACAVGPRRGGRKRNAVGRSREAITIMEVGYGSDTRYHAKLAEKNEQHAQLRSLLTARGSKVTYLPVVLGTMGST